MSTPSATDALQASQPITFSSIGLTLRSAREEQGLSVEHVAQMLRLSVKQVEAMENDAFSELPGPAFVRGFLRNYCRQLGIDADQLLQRLDPIADARSPELVPLSNARGVMPVPGRSRVSTRPLGVIAGVFLLVILLGWYFDWFEVPVNQPVNQPVEPAAGLLAPAARPAPAGVVAPPGAPVTVPPETTPAPPPDEPQVRTGAAAEPEAPVAAAPAPPEVLPPAQQTTTAPLVETPVETAPVAALASDEVRLQLRFVGESWFEVRRGDGERALLATGTEPAGSERTVNASLPLSMIIGNASRVEVVFNGEILDLAPHTRGNVARVRLE